MKRLALALAAAGALVAACAEAPYSSRATFAMPLLNESTIGGPGYPVVVRGAETVGVAPAALAASLRFPAGLRGGSSFRLAEHGPNLVNHAHLTVTGAGENATATLTFLHGERRIGEGVFTLPRAAFADPYAVGSVTAPMIQDLLRRSRDFSRETKESILIPD